MSVSISLRSYFSIQHVQSAAYFARQALRIERDPASKKANGETTAEAIMEHKAVVTASLFIAASFLEATINELFADAADREPRNWADSSAPALLGGMWKHGVPRRAHYSILDKYQIALTLLGKPPFDSGKAPVQDVGYLVKLRNALIHYEPETILVASNYEEIQPQEFEKKLHGKFDLNPLIGGGAEFFPRKCLSYGCARWALLSSVRFTDEFFSRIGMKPTYDHERERLVLE